MRTKLVAIFAVIGLDIAGFILGVDPFMRTIALVWGAGMFGWGSSLIVDELRKEKK